MNRHVFAGGVSAATMVVSALATAAIVTSTSGQAPDFGQVAQWGPEQFGGYSTEYVIIQVQPTLAPAQRADGRWTVDAADPANRPAAVAKASDQMADVLAQWQAQSIRRLSTVEPANVQLAAELGLDRYYRVDVPLWTDTPALAARLRTFDVLLENAEVDGIGGVGGMLVSQVFPNDQFFSLLYGLHNTGQTIQGQSGTPDADIDAPEAWSLHTGDDWIVVAVIDSGVNAHPDIEAKLVDGWNTNSNNSNTSDGVNHGTHVAGTAAATSNNGAGVAGVCWGAKVMPIRVLNNFGSGTEAHCGDGIIWAADNGAHVGNMSLQYYTGTSYFRNAVLYGYNNGMVLVAATGNNQGNIIAFPARWPETIAVGATDNRDQWATFSNYGAEITVSAPGVNVVSLYGTNQYAYASGTSMASPHVAGLAALAWSYNPELTNNEVFNAIVVTAEDKGPAGWDQFFGHGRVNAHLTLVEVGEGDGGDPGGPGEPGDPVMAVLTGYTVVQGTPRNSGLFRLEDSDDVYLSVSSVFAQGRHRTITEVDAVADASIATRIDLTIETGVNKSGVSTYIEVQNKSNGQWVLVDSFSQSVGDSVREIAITSDAASYISGSGAVSVRIRTLAANNVGAYTLDIDHVQIVVTPE